MALLTWSGTLSIGIGALDREHESSSTAINELQAQWTKAKSGASTGPWSISLPI